MKKQVYQYTLSPDNMKIPSVTDMIRQIAFNIEYKDFAFCSKRV